MDTLGLVPCQDAGVFRCQKLRACQRLDTSMLALARVRILRACQRLDTSTRTLARVGTAPHYSQLSGTEKRLKDAEPQQWFSSAVKAATEAWRVERFRNTIS